MATKKTTPKAKSAVATKPKKITPVANATTPVAPTPITKTKVALVVDSSGSMRPHKTSIINLFNKNIEEIRTKDPTAEVTLVYFGQSSAPVKVVFENVGISQVHKINENTYEPDGWTPLYDGVGKAIQTIESTKDHSYLVIVLTDGEENRSTFFNSKSFADLIKQKQGSDIWQFAFLVPPGARERFAQSSGVHIGNITEWESANEASVSLSRATGNYYANRSVGLRSVSNVFDLNLNQVTQTSFEALPDVTSQYRSWQVEAETDIKTFVESKGVDFHIGSGYYEVTKKEDVQDHKQLLVMHRTGKAIKSNVRQLLGMPLTGDIKLVPGNLGDYKVFVQSTSSNRKLVRGTRLLYAKS